MRENVTIRTVLVAVSATMLVACGSGRESALPTPVTQPTPAVVSTSTVSTVPDVVGKRLADAVQVLSAAGYPKVEPVDAGGQHRPIIEPVNWIVAAQEPAGASAVPPGAVITLRVAKPTDPTESAAPQAGVVADVVCKDLQSAQDILQSAGFFNLRSEDATGQGRQQIIDRNWVVVGQSVAAGEQPDKLAPITLSAVKFGEQTGASGCRS